MDDFLPYFERELLALRKDAGEFAAAYPKLAGRLRMTGDTVDDPNVERILEGVAYLGARVQQRLDYELPEITDALLELLCPHLLAPVPSLSTVRLSAKPGMTGASLVPRETRLQTEPVRGEPLHYRTCHDVTLWPVVLEEAQLAGLPFAVPPNPQAQRALSVLRLVFRTAVPGMPFAELGLDRLRLHVRGELAVATQILELLCTSTLSIALADGASDVRPTILGGDSLIQAGFTPEEAALPWPQRAFSGHRLLTEYFAFPQKFLYLDLLGLDARTVVHGSDRLEVFVYLSRPAGNLERSVSAASFALFCTPVVNLFRQRAEPVSLDGTRADWLVQPDTRRPQALEIYAVESVKVSYPEDPEPREVPYFHRLRTGEGAEHVGDLNWFASRRPAPSALGGTETRIMLRDGRFDPAKPADGVLAIDTLCCNRDLPALVPFAISQQAVGIQDPTSPAGGAEFLTAPTPTLRRQLRDQSGWRLVSHLSLNHLGVTGGARGAASIREMLRLHDLRDAPETRLAMEGLVSIEAAPGIARVPGARPGSFARGLEVSLVFEPQAWTAGGLFLLSAVLERFLALQVSVNSFVRTRARLRGRTEPVASWPARSGSRILL